MSAVQPQPPPQDESESPRIISPFAQTTSTIRRGSGSGSSSWALWIVSALLVMVIVGIIGYFTYKYLVDPFRTLEPFEMDKYMSDYHSLKGNKYRAELKVANDLGWTMDTGRVMVFTVGNDDRRLPVLIPPKVGENLYFTKGQTYQAILEVGDGGLVNADMCQKE